MNALNKLHTEGKIYDKQKTLFPNKKEYFSKANFADAKFSSWANFAFCRFVGEVRFSKCEFSDKVYFSGAKFLSESLFSYEATIRSD